MTNVRSLTDKRALLAAADLLGDAVAGEELALREVTRIGETVGGVPIFEGPDPPGPRVNPALAHWARFRDGFAAAMHPDFDTIEELERKLAAGEVQFWPGKGSALITKLADFPGGARAALIEWATGEIEELLTMLPGIDAWARLNGCSRVLVEGQLGWQRVLKGAGFKPWSVTLEKVL